MAQFKYADLSAHEEGDSYNFVINYDIDFQDFEKLILWELTLKFYERDIIRNDLKRVINKTIDPKNLIKRIEESIRKEDLKTEPGDEEYFVKIKLSPTQLPSKDSIITNKTELDI